MDQDEAQDAMHPAAETLPIPAFAAPLAIPELPLLTVVDNPRLEEAINAMPGAVELAQRGHFADAAERWRQIHDHIVPLVDEQANDTVMLVVGYSRMSELVNRGAIKMQLGAMTEGLPVLQKALAAGQDEVVPLLDAIDMPEPRKRQIRFEVDNVSLMLELAEFMRDMHSESFPSAEHRAAEIVTIARGLIDIVATLDVPARQKQQIVASAQMTIATTSAQGEFARAESARQARRWDDALAGYDSVDRMISEAGKQAGRIDVPIADDAQVRLLNSTLIPAARRRLRDDRALFDEGERRWAAAEKEAAVWKSALDSFRSWSPTFNTMVNVQTSIDLIVNVNKVSRERLVDDLGDLRRVTAASTLSAADRDELLARIDQLRGDRREHGESFFKKVAEFVENSGKLLEGLGKAVEPVGRVVKWVAPIVAPTLLSALGLGGAFG